METISQTLSYEELFPHLPKVGGTALLIGVGGIGSKVAVELACNGVSHFILVDNDILKPHNVPRHAGGCRDLGRKKVDIVKDAILDRNPEATVETYDVDIIERVDVLDGLVERADVVICATDNNGSRYVVSDALVRYGRFGLFPRVWSRATALDLFVQRPGGACFACFIGGSSISEEITNAESAIENGNLPSYTSPEDAEKVVLVGLAVDVQPLCTMTTLLAMSEFTHGMEAGMDSRSEDIGDAELFIWCNRREDRCSVFTPLGGGDGPQPLSWMKATITKKDGCAICSDNIKLH